MNTETGVKKEPTIVQSLSGVTHASDLDSKGYVLQVSYQESKLSDVENVVVLAEFLPFLVLKQIESVPR